MMHHRWASTLMLALFYWASAIAQIVGNVDTAFGDVSLFFPTISPSVPPSSLRTPPFSSNNGLEIKTYNVSIIIVFPESQGETDRGYEKKLPSIDEIESMEEECVSLLKSNFERSAFQDVDCTVKRWFWAYNYQLTLDMLIAAHFYETNELDTIPFIEFTSEIKRILSSSNINEKQTSEVSQAFAESASIGSEPHRSESIGDNFIDLWNSLSLSVRLGFVLGSSLGFLLAVAFCCLRRRSKTRRRKRLRRYRDDRQERRSEDEKSYDSWRNDNWLDVITDWVFPLDDDDYSYDNFRQKNRREHRYR